MRVLRKGTNRSLSFTIAATIVLWAASSSLFLWTTNAEEESCDEWDLATCTDNPCSFGKNKTCTWAAHKRTKKRCGRPLVEENCPVTCNEPECTALPSTFPTAHPSMSPTAHRSKSQKSHPSMSQTPTSYPQDVPDNDTLSSTPTSYPIMSPTPLLSPKPTLSPTPPL
mmetsp:Transcript_8632/g.21069  ORF Transcript_8632/g.21069 Transcript_8632/m.21069 type:complete len:168 (-) Transcript_8632:825-1328(-)